MNRVVIADAAFRWACGRRFTGANSWGGDSRSAPCLEWLPKWGALRESEERYSRRPYLNNAFRSPHVVVSAGTDWPAKGANSTVAGMFGLSLWSMIQDWMSASLVVPQ